MIAAYIDTEPTPVEKMALVNTSTKGNKWGLATGHATGSPTSKTNDTPLAAHTDNDRIGSSIKGDERIESCGHTICDKFNDDRNLGEDDEKGSY